ncbi:hypothetical protein EV368DRAFT_88602 [Lentinula lateritia]|nr:hypothetical protein EV368DRAFT_88602 [Lentinula lateritia]
MGALHHLCNIIHVTLTDFSLVDNDLLVKFPSVFYWSTLRLQAYMWDEEVVKQLLGCSLSLVDFTIDISDDDIDWIDVLNFLSTILECRPHLTKLKINASIPPLEWIPLNKYDALKELCPTLTVLVVDQRMWKHRLGMWKHCLGMWSEVIFAAADKFPDNALKIANGSRTICSQHFFVSNTISSQPLSPMPSIFVPLPSQQCLYDLVVDYVDAVCAGGPVNQLLLLVHGGAGSRKSAMMLALFQFITDNYCPTLAFKGAATNHAAAVIGGVSLASSPHMSTIDCRQEYFLIDAANALNVAILSNLSTQLNDIHHTPSAIFGGEYHDFLRLNSHIVKPSDFVSTHANEKFAVITTSSVRCKRLNMELPIHVVNALNTTIYMLNATDTVSFSIGATMSIADITFLQDNVANCGDIPGKMAVYIGMPCLVIIDSTPVWGVVFDIELDSREDVQLPRPTLVCLTYPPLKLTVKVAEEVLLHNVDLRPFLHLKPVCQHYDWFMDNDNTELGYVVRVQVPITPKLAIVKEECEGQLFNHLLLDTQHGLQSLHSLYLVASRVPNINLLSVTHKVQCSSDVGWLLSLRETILHLLYL